MFLRSAGLTRSAPAALGFFGLSRSLKSAAVRAPVCFRSFLLRGFFVFLTYMPHVLPTLPSVAQLPPRGYVQASRPRYPSLFKGVVSLSVLWGQWLAFFNIVTALIAARTTLTVVGHPDLTVLTRALSWATWRSSFWGWRLFLTGDPSFWAKGPSCFILFSSKANVSARCVSKALGHRTSPVLGVGSFDVYWGAWSHVFSANTHKTFQVFFCSLSAWGWPRPLLLLNANYSSVFDVVFSPLSRLLLYSFLGLYGFIGCCRVGLGRIDYLVWGVWVVLFRSYVFFLSIHAQQWRLFWVFWLFCYLTSTVVRSTPFNAIFYVSASCAVHGFFLGYLFQLLSSSFCRVPGCCGLPRSLAPLCVAL